MPNRPIGQVGQYRTILAEARRLVKLVNNFSAIASQGRPPPDRHDFHCGFSALALPLLQDPILMLERSYAHPGSIPARQPGRP